jgi:hypothetical protein
MRQDLIAIEDAVRSYRLREAAYEAYCAAAAMPDRAPSAADTASAQRRYIDSFAAWASYEESFDRAYAAVCSAGAATEFWRRLGRGPCPTAAG